MFLLYSHLKRVLLARRNTRWTSSLSASLELWWFFHFVGATQLDDKPSFHEGVRRSGSMHSCTQAPNIRGNSWMVFMQTTCDSLKWSQGRYESRHCLSKPGSNQAHHQPQGPSWKSLLLNNVLLLLLVWNKNNSNNTYHYYHDHLRGSLLRGVFWGKTTGRCQGSGRRCWKKKIVRRLCSRLDYNRMTDGDYSALIL